MNPFTRHPVVLLTILVAACLTACVPTDRSVVTGDVQVFDEALLGEWKTGSLASDRLTIAKHTDGKSYAVTTYDDKGQRRASQIVFRLMKLGDQHFYELEVREPEAARGDYAVGRLTIEKDRITGWTFEKDEDAFKQPDAQVAELDAGGEKQKVLAMEPAKVQAYLKAHAKEMTRRALDVDRVPAAK